MQNYRSEYHPEQERAVEWMSVKFDLVVLIVLVVLLTKVATNHFRQILILDLLLKISIPV